MSKKKKKPRFYYLIYTLNLSDSFGVCQTERGFFLFLFRKKYYKVSYARLFLNMSLFFATVFKKNSFFHGLSVFYRVYGLLAGYSQHRYNARNECRRYAPEKNYAYFANTVTEQRYGQSVRRPQCGIRNGNRTAASYRRKRENDKCDYKRLVEKYAENIARTRADSS